jgi:hypothetical protein
VGTDAYVWIWCDREGYGVIWVDIWVDMDGYG